MLVNVLKRALGALTQSRGTKPAPMPPQESVPADLTSLLEQARSAHQRGALSEALQAYESAFRLLPESQSEARAAVWVNMGAIWREMVRLPKAIACLQEALLLQPGLAVAHYNLGLNLYEIGEAEAAESSLNSALAIQPDFQAAHSTRLCLFGLARNHDPERVLAEHRLWAAEFADPLTAQSPPHANERSTHRRLTVGYVSADFKEHSVARFISPILANHDRARFRVICYDNWPRSDATTERLRGYVDAWRKIDELDDPQAADLVRADGVDILVDLSGHTTGNRLLLFARKPAPVQASWLGYMSTTGMAAMDWHITDAHLDPPGVSEGWYTERLMRIDSAAAFEPHPDSPPVNALPCLDSGYLRFASFNNYTKIGDEVIALWARLLATIPNARLLLVALGGDEADFQALVRARFERLGASNEVSARVDVMGMRPLKDFLRLFHQVDIALDSFPYGGGTTTLHTLWMGVPVVTLEGQSELARGTSGILTACGLGELIARSSEEYLRIGVDLAMAPARVATLRSQLRERLAKSVLGNGLQVTRSLEAAYLKMWEDFVRQDRPAVRPVGQVGKADD
jgi:protein O-GlcNAc transferase